MRNTLPIGWREQGIIGGRQKRRANGVSWQRRLHAKGAAKRTLAQTEKEKENERGKYLLGNIYTVYDLSGAKKRRKARCKEKKKKRNSIGKKCPLWNESKTIAIHGKLYGAIIF
ncbi:hypothetical protein K0M31_020132 [Melipona bicolor]|uniref:Uncharacterized protein n=1 Tax=Melipona bicolor TaxID=60889 RepID=A0AA40KQF7_9HYME|nr:hypothetical protein K0M31_020132 [Melipona bicolor]